MEEEGLASTQLAGTSTSIIIPNKNQSLINRTSQAVQMLAQKQGL